MNQKKYLQLMFLFLFQLMNAQVGIGTTAPNASSELEIASPLNDKGVLIPRMTQAQRNLIASPATSLLIYQTDNTPGFYYYNGTIWVGITAGASTDWTLLGNSGTTSATNFFGTTDDNDIVFKRNSIRAGFIGNPISTSPFTTVNRRNTSFGANSLLNPAGGYRNTAIGSNVMSGNTSGNRNVAIGDVAMSSNTSGQQNVAIGVGALFTNQLGNSNVAIGRNALTLTNGTTGTQASNNTAVGMISMELNTTGAYNSAFGRESLYNNSTGDYNVGIGWKAGFANVVGINNVSIGNSAGLASTGSNNITIGSFSEVPVLTNSDQLSIGNVIYGTTMTSTAAGKIGIGESNPNAKLQITSSSQASPAITDGIIIPKVDNLAATPTAAQEGMLVYLNALSGTNQPGFYYWDNDIPSWVGLNSTVNGDHDWYKEGTATAPTLITDDMFHMGNVAIGKNTADYPLDIETTNSNIGLNNNFTNFISSGLQRIGIKSNVNVSSTGDAIGMRSDVTGPNSGRKIGYYSDIFGSGTGQKIGTLNYVDNGGIGTAWAINNTVDGFGSGIAYGIENNLISSTSGNQYGISNTINNGSGGIHYGIKNSLLSPGLGDKYGMQNEIINSSTGTIYGVNNIITNATTQNIYGNKTSVTGNNNMYGSDIQLINNGTDNTRIITGSAVNISGTTTSAIKGTDTQISTSGNSAMYGNYTSITPTASGTGPKYGSYNLISTTAGGDHYGVYSNVLKAGATNFAGYFLGNVGIGTTNLNTYTLPASRATSAGQIMQSNATGVVTWQTPAAALNSYAWLTTGNTSVATDFLGTNNAFPLRFVTTGTERMRVSATGNIGINTLTPSGTDRINIVTGTGMNGILLTSQQTTSGSYGFRNTATFTSGSANVYTGYNGTITTAGGTATNAGLFSEITSGDAPSIIGSTSGTALSASIIGTSSVWHGVNARSSAANANALVGVNSAASGTSTGNGISGQTSQRDGAAIYGYNDGPAGVSFGFATGDSRVSIYGNARVTGSYSFGVLGDAGTSIRSGGVLGDDYGVRGALGYYNSALVDYAVYGFGTAYQTGGVGGRPGSAIVADQPNNMVGLGIYGGVMGGWVRGMNYGFHAKGKEYGMYVDGNTITNKPVVQLIENGKERRTISYSTTSMSVDVYTRGTNALVNGSAYINFKEDFSSITSKEIPLNITVTPTGASKGVYVTDISNEGFRIVENGDGRSNVSVNWVAYGTRIGYENPEEILSEEILSSKFDENMDAVMYNDNNTDGQQKGIWFDGTKVQTGKTPDSFQQAKLAKGQNKKRPSTEAVKTQEQK